MTPADDYETRRQTVRYAVERIRNAMQGVGPEYAECFPRKPSDAHPSGTLFPGAQGGTVRDVEEGYGRVSFTPTALGVKVNVAGNAPLPCRLDVRVGLYYPVRPSHAEALRWLADYAGNAQDLKLPYKYRRIDVDAHIDVEVPLDAENEFAPHEEATAQLQAALDAAAQQAADDPEIAMVGARDGGGHTIDCQRHEVEDPEQFARLFQQAAQATPAWRGEVHYRVVHDGDETFLEILVHNASERQAQRYETAFVGVRATLTAPADRLRRFRLREIEARDYRHDAATWATGRNAYAEGRREGQSVVVETDSVPLHVQRRLTQRTWDGPDGPIDLRFSRLADDPLPVLDALLQSMRTYLGEWNQLAKEAEAAADEPEQVEEGKRAFEEELKRFAAGVARLRAEPHVLTAFKLMNRSFAQRFLEDDARWRLFQLAFIVSEIEDLALRGTGRAPEHGPSPTVLWFPTGGGKTEAYLGLVVWHAFWDRLRGKPFGTTAFAKFPLRMLSLQQFSRVVAVMEHAEDVRQQTPELEDCRGDPFSVGYYAGGGNSENLIDWPVSPDGTKRSSISDWIKRKARSAEQRRRWEALHRKVAHCPMCEGAIETRFSESKPGFTHTCGSCNRALQLHLTDTEVLRWLPTIVIATVDKLARFAYEHWGRSLFGDVVAACEDHGYLIARPSEGNRCPVLDCRKNLREPPANVDPVPAILIQDELHVLSESLGAMASHYETTLQDTMRRKPGHGPWKIVGSTATIEGYRQLVRQLYNHGSCTRFPAQGPNGRENFYVKDSDEEQRFILGIRTHGMSHVDATMKQFLEYHRALAPVFDRANCDAVRRALPAHLAGISDEDLRDLARWYRTVVCYGINKNEVSQVARSFAGQLNAYCQREGLVEFDDDRVDLLTGDNSIEEIQGWLDSVERLKEPYRQAAAVTSLFGLGVDIQWLNMIAFRGIPHGTAELIQALSRVGRKEGVPSIVGIVYNPNRERDASYFEAHKKYLEFASILIRHVPTTRFSKQALELTLPGVFMHQVNFHNPVPEIWKRQSVAGAGAELRGNEVRYLADVERALGVTNAPDPASSLVLRQKQHVGVLLGRVRTELLRKTPGVNPIQESAKDRLHIPNSLRSTDETIRVYSSGSVGGDDA